MLPNAGAASVQPLAHFSIMAACSSRSRAVLAREPGAANRTKGESSMNTLFKLTSSLVLLTLLPGAGSTMAVQADFDLDGRMDIAVTNQVAGTVSILFGPTFSTVL